MSENQVWSIAIVASRTGLHPQTIRTWERVGLIRPLRTSGNARRFNENLLKQLLHIQKLMSLGLSLEAVQYVLELEYTVNSLRRELAACQRSKQR